MLDRCNCENTNCHQIDELSMDWAGCRNRFNPDKKIRDIGAVCDDCFAQYPEQYRLPPGTKMEGYGPYNLKPRIDALRVDLTMLEERVKTMSTAEASALEGPIWRCLKALDSLEFDAENMRRELKRLEELLHDEKPTPG